MVIMCVLGVGCWVLYSFVDVIPLSCFGALLIRSFLPEERRRGRPGNQKRIRTQQIKHLLVTLRQFIQIHTITLNFI